MAICLGIFSLSSLTSSSFAQIQTDQIFANAGVKKNFVIAESSEAAPIFRSNPFWDNWFIGAGVGGQVYLGDHNRQMGLGELLTPAFNVHAGKWLVPEVGLRLGVSGFTIKGATQNGSHSTGEVYDASQRLMKQKFNYFHIHTDVLFNTFNILDGYVSGRSYNLNPFIGIGLMQALDEPKRKEFSLSVGVSNSLQVSEVIGITLDVRGSLVRDRFDGEVGERYGEGVLASTLGITYNIPTR